MVRRSELRGDADRRFLDRVTGDLLAALAERGAGEPPTRGRKRPHGAADADAGAETGCGGGDGLREPCHVMVFGHGAPPTGCDATFREPADAERLLQLGDECGSWRGAEVSISVNCCKFY